MQWKQAERGVALRERLGTVRERDLSRRVPRAGPQQDDVRIVLDGRSRAACVSALSKRLELDIWRDGRRWHQDHERGTPMTALADVAEAERVDGRPRRGTNVRFWPDPDICE